MLVAASGNAQQSPRGMPLSFLPQLRIIWSGAARGGCSPTQRVVSMEAKARGDPSIAAPHVPILAFPLMLRYQGPDGEDVPYLVNFLRKGKH